MVLPLLRERTQAAIFFRKNALEQKAKVKLKSCSVRQWMIMRKRNLLPKRKISQSDSFGCVGRGGIKTGTLSNGTVENYLGTIRNIKKHPLAERKLKNVTSEHLQSFFDLLPSGSSSRRKERKGYSKDYIHSFPQSCSSPSVLQYFQSSILRSIAMQYIKLRYQTDGSGFVFR